MKLEDKINQAKRIEDYRKELARQMKGSKDPLEVQELEEKFSNLENEQNRLSIY